MNNIIQKTERKKKHESKKSKKVQSIKDIHNEKLRYFENLQTVVLPKKIKEFKKSKDTSTLPREIEDIQNRIEETYYYLETVKVLEDYDNPEIVDKDDIINEYYSIIGVTNIRNSDTLKIDLTKCDVCGSYELEEYENGINCLDCGVTNTDHKLYIDKLSYNELQDYEHNEKVFYKRLVYFKELLSQIQSKENTTIPDHVISSVLLEIKKRRITDLNTLTKEKIRYFLNKLGLPKYYEHIPYIMSIITGTNTFKLTLSQELEEKLIETFNTIQPAWEYVSKILKLRSSFLNYHYTFRKLFELLGYPEYIQYFSELKKREKIADQDDIWKQMLMYLNNEPISMKENRHLLVQDIEWIFIKSV